MSNENEPIDVSPENPGETTPLRQFWGMNLNTYCMLMNLIQILPGWGQIGAILMWIMNKDNSPEIDRYGKNVTNWIISFVIYVMVASMINLGIGVIGLFLTIAFHAPFIFIGHLSAVFTSIVFIMIGLAFPIIAAVKANHGVLWKYPLSIQFFK